jgi:hypothetical protein
MQRGVPVEAKGNKPLPDCPRCSYIISILWGLVISRLMRYYGIWWCAITKQREEPDQSHSIPQGELSSRVGWIPCNHARSCPTTTELGVRDCVLFSRVF